MGRAFAPLRVVCCLGNRFPMEMISSISRARQTWARPRGSSFFFGNLISWPRVRLYQRTLGDRQGAVFAVVLALAALAAGLLVAFFFHFTGLSIHYKLIVQQML